MLPKTMRKEDLRAFVEGLLSENTVAAPVRKANKFAFADVNGFDEIALDYNTSLLSPRKYFYPMYEAVLKFTLGQQPAAEPVVESAPRMVFGMHPCDVAATWILDVVFSDSPADPNYLEKRKKAVIIGVNCAKPCDDFCFCKDMKTHNATEGFDLMFTDIGAKYFVEVGTGRGEELLVGGDFAAASAQDMKELQDWQDRKEKNFKNRIPYDTKFLPEILGQSDTSLVWDAIARKCFSCGSCNTTCPTCYCFNIKDEVTASLAEGVRKRIWDSCQLAEFTEVAGGEVFRKDRSARLRHRFNRKGKWLLEKFGRLGCVGCGRCDRNCLVKISSVEVYTQLAGEQAR